MFYRVLFIVVCIGSHAIFAQQNSLFVTEIKYVPGTSNTVGFQKSMVGFNYPIALKKGTLTNSLQYSNYKMDYNSNEKLDYSTLNLKSFNSIAYSLSFNNELSNDWAYTISVAPTIASNFNSSVSINDVSIEGGLVFSKIIADKKLHLGVVRNSSFGFETLIPVISVDGAINKNLRYSIGFPITEFLYSINNINQFGAYVKPEGFYANTGNNLVINNDTVEKAKFQSFVSGIKFSHCIDDNWKIEFDAGYQLKSDYDLLDENNNSVYEFKTKNNISAGVSLKFNLLNNKS